MYRQVNLEGIATIKAIIKNQFGNMETETVRTLISMPAVRIDDWQYDGGIWHNEGGYDYDVYNFTVKYPDEFDLFTKQGWIESSFKTIDKGIKIIDGLDNLEEV